MSRATEGTNRRMLRARDTMDRDYARPLDVPALARVAHVSPAHFARTFRATFGETPHRYLQRRRVERAMYLLRESDRPLSELAAVYDGYSRSGEINSTVEDAQACIDAVAQAFSGRGEIDLGDGLSVTNADERWWVNLRPSNTEPLLRLNVEAADDTQMASLRDEVLVLVRR